MPVVEPIHDATSCQTVPQLVDTLRSHSELKLLLTSNTRCRFREPALKSSLGYPQNVSDLSLRHTSNLNHPAGEITRLSGLVNRSVFKNLVQGLAHLLEPKAQVPSLQLIIIS